ncbi:hypothetical protein [Nostoc sp.]
MTKTTPATTLIRCERRSLPLTTRQAMTSLSLMWLPILPSA